MQKNTWRILSLGCMAALLSSCVPAEDVAEPTWVSQSASPPRATAELTANPNDEPLPATRVPVDVEIELWHPWSGEMANLIEELADEFNSTNEWGITVQPTARADDQALAQNILNLTESADDPPDLVAAPYFLISFMVAEGIDLQDLDSFIQSPEWGIGQDYGEDLSPIYKDNASHQVIRVGFPAYRTANFLLYNQTWAEELGFNRAPDTLDAFREQMCAASRENLSGRLEENIGTGGWVYSHDPLVTLSWLRAFGGGVGNGAEGGAVLSTKQNIKSSAFLYDMFLPVNNCAWQGRQPKSAGYFSKRQALAYSGKLEDVLVQEKANQSSPFEDEWTVIPYPSVAGKPVVIIESDAYSITTQDEGHALAAWEFVKWMSSPSVQARVVEATGSLPLSSGALELLDEYRKAHPVWEQALSYMALAEHAPLAGNWLVTRSILSDVSWQLIQYTVAQADIPAIWQSAEDLHREFVQE